jgi:hypothetical protein
MYPQRLPLTPVDRFAHAPAAAMTGFVAIPACMLPAGIVECQNQLYAWALSRAQAAVAPRTRIPDLFANCN